MDERQASHGLIQWHGTTIIGVKKGGKTVIAGDGQVSMGNTVMKPNARKVRRLGEDGAVIAGFAGATADAFTLFERLERKLEQYRGQLATPASDLYALGCVMFQLVTGELPFLGSAAQALGGRADRPPPTIDQRVGGVPAELVDADVEGEPGARRVLLEDRGDRLALERLGAVRLGLELVGQVEDVGLLLRGQVVVTEKVPGHQRSFVVVSSASRKPSACSAVSVSGGASRIVSGWIGLTR